MTEQHTLSKLFISTDDSGLVSLAQSAPARYSSAFTELYRRHFHRVYRYLLSRTGDELEAQDLTSQTFIAALESLAAFKGRGSFSAWLLAIARNKSAQRFRSQRFEAPLEAAEELADPEPLPEVITNRRWQLTQLKRALNTLAPDRSEALRLRFFADLEAAEVCEVMGKTEAAVKMLIFRGLRDMRQNRWLHLQEVSE